MQLELLEWNFWRGAEL